MSALDAVDCFSTGTWVPRMWVRLALPRFGGANHASGHNDQSGHSEVGPILDTSAVVCAKIEPAVACLLTNS
jgi:hypothetical protein